MIENDVNNYTEEELKIWFTTDNVSGYKSTEKWLSKHLPKLYEKIINNSANSCLFKEKILLYLNNINEIPKCPICGKNCTFLGSVNRGFSTFCSSTCSNKSESTLNKKKITYYSDEHISKKKDIRRKIEITCRNNYGVDNPMKVQKIRDKQKKTTFNKYGVDNVFKSEVIKEKIKKTNVIKYGVEHLSYDKNHINSIKNKIKLNAKIKMIENVSNTLNLNNCDVNIHDNELIISNYCKYHKTFTIIKNNYFSRLRSNTNLCTECYPISQQSSINELEVLDFIINELNLNASKIKIDKCEIDIYLPEHKIGIEFNGIYYHSTKFKNIDFHLNKTNLCKKRGIQLLHIFEDEWANKRDIVKSIIKSKLGIIENKIFARKCEIKEINNNNSIRNFLNNNHIQGFIGGKIKLGLYYDDELVSIMTFGKKRLAMGNKISIDGEYEMLRFCNKLNTTVIGGASKLLSYFVKTYQPKSILTYADRRYSNGGLYLKLGFKFIGNSDINYWYFIKNTLIRYHRFKFRKNVLVEQGFDKNKTEHQIMMERGYHCVYDCGNMKFEMIL
jgi:hypothetical protein